MMRNILSTRALIALSSSLLLASCGQHTPSGQDLQLLTSTPWKYEQSGFYTDDNEEDQLTRFNDLDPHISGNERDNYVVFHTDGTGSDNRLPFTWSFQNNDSILYFQDRYYRVKTLNNNRLVMYADQKYGRTHTHYTIVLKH